MLAGRQPIRCLCRINQGQEFRDALEEGSAQNGTNFRRYSSPGGSNANSLGQATKELGPRLSGEKNEGPRRGPGGTANQAVALCLPSPAPLRGAPIPSHVDPRLQSFLLCLGLSAPPPSGGKCSKIKDLTPLKLVPFGSAYRIQTLRVEFSIRKSVFCG